jgi:hypothetical protein
MFRKNHGSILTPISLDARAKSLSSFASDVGGAEKELVRAAAALTNGSGFLEWAALIVLFAASAQVAIISDAVRTTASLSPATA